MTTLLHSARRIDGAGDAEDAWVLIDGSVIAASGEGLDTAPDSDQRIDLEGAVITPGFIDLHGHGGGGHAYEDGGDELIAALAAHRRHGTTRSVVSLVANPLDATRSALAGIAELAAHDPLVLGAHLEGPYLEREHRGAHNPEFLRHPSPDEVQSLIAAGHGALRQVTIAPELPGALDAIDAFVAAGIKVAVGHTGTDARGAAEAFDHGATLLTHAFNAMSGIHHREPGPVVAALGDERVTIELILDGLHVHPDVARMLVATAPGRIALVTDGMAAAGSEDGHYTLGSLNVTVRDGLAVLSGTNTIAGSTLTQDVALRIAIEQVGMDPVDAVAAATLVPAYALGMADHLGLLETGFAADVVVFDQEWRVTRVWADGIELS